MMWRTTSTAKPSASSPRRRPAASRSSSSTTSTLTAKHFAREWRERIERHLNRARCAVPCPGEGGGCCPAAVALSRRCPEGPLGICRRRRARSQHRCATCRRSTACAASPSCAVLAFHGGYLHGGYLGVDLFFTLSGFLITRLIIDDLVRDRFSLKEFWGRRARRLLPACWVLIAAVLLAGPVLVRTTELATLRGDAFATLGYVANWWQVATSSSYFAMFTTPSPLQHTWSLAIEEQLYVLWPLVLIVLWRVGRRRIGVLAVAAAVLASLSLIEAALLYSSVDDGARVYYGTDTRSASVLIGAIAAIMVWRFGPALSRWRGGGCRGVGRCRRHRRRVGPWQQRRVALRGGTGRTRGSRRRRARGRHDTAVRPAPSHLVDSATRRHRCHQLRPVPVPLAVVPVALARAHAPRRAPAVRAATDRDVRRRDRVVLPDRAPVPPSPVDVLVARRSALSRPPA